MIDTIIDSQQAAGGTTTRRPRSIGPALLTLLIAGIVFLPIGALLLIAAGGGDGSWAHLSSTILPRSIRTTITLLAYVAVLTVVVGVITAWLIVTFEYPQERMAGPPFSVGLSDVVALFPGARVEALDEGPVERACFREAGVTAIERCLAITL